MIQRIRAAFASLFDDALPKELVSELADVSQRAGELTVRNSDLRARIYGLERELKDAEKSERITTETMKNWKALAEQVTAQRNVVREDRNREFERNKDLQEKLQGTRQRIEGLQAAFTEENHLHMLKVNQRNAQRDRAEAAERDVAALNKLLGESIDREKGLNAKLAHRRDEYSGVEQDAYELILAMQEEGMGARWEPHVDRVWSAMFDAGYLKREEAPKPTEKYTANVELRDVSVVHEIEVKLSEALPELLDPDRCGADCPMCHPEVRS